MDEWRFAFFWVYGFGDDVVLLPSFFCCLRNRGRLGVNYDLFGRHVERQRCLCLPSNRDLNGETISFFFLVFFFSADELIGGRSGREGSGRRSTLLGVFGFLRKKRDEVLPLVNARMPSTAHSHRFWLSLLHSYKYGNPFFFFSSRKFGCVKSDVFRVLLYIREPLMTRMWWWFVAYAYTRKICRPFPLFWPTRTFFLLFSKSESRKLSRTNDHLSCLKKRELLIPITCTLHWNPQVEHL